jgi:hypothetical protein
MLTDNKRIARDKNKVNGEAEKPYPSHTPNSGRMGRHFNAFGKCRDKIKSKTGPPAG